MSRLFENFFFILSIALSFCFEATLIVSRMPRTCFIPELIVRAKDGGIFMVFVALFGLVV